MSLWGTLAPLVLGSALVPIQIVITILLLRTKRGALTAASFVAGAVVVQLIQGILFGLVFNPTTDTESTSKTGSGIVLSVVLLVVAVLFFVTAIKQLVARVDDDAPPPKWMSLVGSMTPLRAFLFGIGAMAISVKFWVFTLGAVSAISGAKPGVWPAIGVFLLFVLLSQILRLAVLLVAALAPRRSAALLDGTLGWMTKHNRVIMIVIGAVFGTWFLIKALSGLGIL